MFFEVLETIAIFMMAGVNLWIIFTGAHKRWAEDVKRRYDEKMAEKAKAEKLGHKK